MTTRALFTALALLAASGCESVVVEDGDDDGGGGVAATTGSTGPGPTGAGGSAPSGCPVGLPAAGTSCPGLFLMCTYGASDFVSCRASASCLDDGWHIQLPPPNCEVVDPACPPEAPPPQSLCPSEGVKCAFAGGTQCLCTTCFGGPCGPPPPLWVCGTPGAECPEVPPNAGAPCSSEGLQCVYGDPCSTGVDARCEGGAWVWEPGVCPQ